MTNPSTNYGLTKESTLIPKLTTLTNRRITSSTVTVSDLIPLEQQSTSLGLSRNSTLILDPPVNSGDILITTDGQYLPEDFNSQGLYDPTHSAGFEYINSVTVNITKNYNINNFYWKEFSTSDYLKDDYICNYIYLDSNVTKITWTIKNNNFVIGNNTDHIYIRQFDNNRFEYIFRSVGTQNGSLTITSSCYWVQLPITAGNGYVLLYKNGSNDYEFIGAGRAVPSGLDLAMKSIGLYNGILTNYN